MKLPPVLDIATLQQGYRAAAFTPLDVMHAVVTRCAQWPDRAVWISRVPDEELLAEARTLAERGGPSAERPLWGIPFAVKDNIDCAGLPTTAACPAYSYMPKQDAFAIARLRAAGALLVGKTNLDQFATGLNGTRSPYGAPRSVFDERYISGGSSSGSAVAVGAGLVAFALGTDTAGSGRVPAAFNNLVGLKPTPGLVSTSGLVPACRSLDCISVLAGTVGDAGLVLRTMRGFDDMDDYSRISDQRALPVSGLRFGVLGAAERQFFGDAETEALYDAAVERFEGLGAQKVEIDYAPFRETAQLLYGGPWVAERLAAIENFAVSHAAEIDPVVLGILEGAREKTAVEAFQGQYRLSNLRRRSEREWAKIDVLLLPTTPTIYSVEAMKRDPVGLNSNLGRYTNFVNLLDCCAVAIPAGFRADGLPAGVTLIAPAFCDDALAYVADTLHRACPTGMGIDRAAILPSDSTLERPTSDTLELAVVGAHLSGMPLNHQLIGAGGKLVRTCKTASDYRLFVLPGTTPPKPGMVREPGLAGPGLSVEVWALPKAAFGTFVDAIPAPLGIGKVTLDDGTHVSGFLCEAHAVEGADEITELGGWRAYIATRQAH
ncbi:MAG: allophanate hydrolase [Beijerinckiaceae bacterium]|nr:allophanate hydrolase [Beijerinckiaceae bacterium]